MEQQVEKTNEQFIKEMIDNKGIQDGGFTDEELVSLKLFYENYFEMHDYNLELQEELHKEKEKNDTLEKLLQGNLYEMYLYYKEVASRYQANSVSKEQIKDKLNKLQNEYEIILDCDRTSREKEIACYQYNSMRNVLEELLNEN